MKVLVIHTGGTLDAEAATYSPDTLTTANKIFVSRNYLEKASRLKNWNIDFDFYEYDNRDSALYTRDDMQKIAQIIIDSKADHVIVTHGTDFMAQNSRILKEMLGSENSKKVVFTGAMEPLGKGKKRERGGGSDGYSNLILAVECLKDLLPGVYVAMHDKVYSSDEHLKKDKQRFVFEGNIAREMQVSLPSPTR